ncbi:hypothetical protein ACFPM0_10385 [Pseudonocardia sulfidoxydans]
MAVIGVSPCERSRGGGPGVRGEGSRRAGMRGDGTTASPGVWTAPPRVARFPPVDDAGPASTGDLDAGESWLEP